MNSENDRFFPERIQVSDAIPDDLRDRYENYARDCWRLWKREPAPFPTWLRVVADIPIYDVKPA